MTVQSNISAVEHQATKLLFLASVQSSAFTMKRATWSKRTSTWAISKSHDSIFCRAVRPHPLL
ncbi:MAG: hypothetical protein AUH08_10715 [Verrucomicrobia bacterium 13_2_20CM_54_12]|nr:MAG: hypothetical protein AUH08_10715 [Verrucomicrobia bacterium 13_2_20CM_54_12]OLD90381.1 MAG: hypothetical protein AUG81_02690 [Verrucomicrobia bacterium 13_1_20CM_4_54_11]PYK12154.1 MAG: hypothetical protein DME64_17260 [Verrucomicrobiota bacterium]